jgi:glutamyl-tRNA(Gln) amidotransferase subunit E
LISGEKIGLEIHIQLNTGKLFCRCGIEAKSFTEERISRRLFATSGEMGITDQAAGFEKERDRHFIYSISDNTCLVEMDEDPPHSIDPAALETALIVSRKLGCVIFDRICTMRKMVIDGSNTSGFQRTALIGINGGIKTSRGNVRISSVCLEEDSARKTEEDGKMVKYSLDRLGIPLIEISTEPDILDEDHAVETAKAVSFLVMASGRFRKSAEAIRQDVNVSFGYGRIEIKGVSKISEIRDAIRSERERNEWIANAVSIIRERGSTGEAGISFRDYTPLFLATGSKMIKDSVSKGNSVLISPARNLSGLMKSGKFRMGREIADALHSIGINGMIHSDELPGYGIDDEEVDKIVKGIGISQNDGFMIVLARSSLASEIERTVKERLAKLMSLNLSETRAIRKDGTTMFMRPLPGKERMYPETDIPYISYNPSVVDEKAAKLPATIDEASEGLSRMYGISVQDSRTIYSENLLTLFEEIARATEDPRWSARFLLQKKGELEGKTGRTIPDNELVEALGMMRKQGLKKESMEMGLSMMYENGSNLREILESESVRPLTEDEINRIVSDIIIETGKKSSSGQIMAVFRERVKRPYDPKSVVELIRKLTGR